MQPKKTPNINPLSPYVCTCTFFKEKLHKVEVIVLNQDDLSGNVRYKTDHSDKGQNRNVVAQGEQV